VTVDAHRSYHHGDLRNALLATAMELARDGGPTAITVREAARRIGVSPSAAYRHFADQFDLLKAVAAAALQELAGRMRAAVDAVPKVRDPQLLALNRFRAVGLAYVDYALSSPGLFRTGYAPGVVLSEPAHLHTSGRDVAPRDSPAPDHPLVILSETLDDLVTVGALAPSQRRYAEVAAWSGVHGLSVLVLDGVLGDAAADPRPLIDSTLDMIGLGLCAPALLEAGQTP
jgi:AcrR family transcriptional regulator